MFEEFGITESAYQAKMRKRIQAMKMMARRRAEAMKREGPLPVKQKREVFMTAHGPAYVVHVHEFISLMASGGRTMRVTLPWVSALGR